MGIRILKWGNTMYCSKCGFDNKDDAQFCKKCGNALNIHSSIKQFNEISKNDNSSNNNNKLIAIVITVIIIALIIAGTFVFLSNNENTTSNNDTLNNSTNVDKTNTVNTEKVDSQSTSSLKIISGSFSTGSPLPQKTYITVYVGEEHAGEKCQIRVFYSHEGTRLNAGNIVDETVDNTGHFTMRTANELNYYPDYAEITLYDAMGNVADTMNVNMKTTSGTQTF